MSGQNSRTKPSNQNWNDDEYAAILDEVKKVYRKKIRPLEVTYNFEGKQIKKVISTRFIIRLFPIFNVK
jgi:hypothetical protein